MSANDKQFGEQVPNQSIAAAYDTECSAGNDATRYDPDANVSVHAHSNGVQSTATAGIVATTDANVLRSANANDANAATTTARSAATTFTTCNVGKHGDAADASTYGDDTHGDDAALGNVHAVLSFANTYGFYATQHNFG